MDKLTLDKIDDFLRGTAFLGTGGGGNPYVGGLMLRQELEKGFEPKLIKGDEVGDDDLILPIANMGAPTVLVEKLPNAKSAVKALRKMEELMGKKATALIAAEAGGINGTLPFIVSAYTGLPVIDADGMGRAFPELQMCTFGVYGVNCSPVIVRDEKDNEMVVDAENNHASEMFARVICMQMGTKSEICLYPMTGKQIRETSVHNTIKLSFEIGSLIQKARDDKNDPVEEIIKYMGKSNPPRVGKLLFTGKIDDLLRETVNGWTRGKMYLKSLNDKDTLLVEFQNEFSYAKLNDNKVLAMVPDLICALDSETGEPITTDSLRYGQRIKIVAVSVPPIMRSEKALKLFGPRAFGLPFDYTPLEDIS